MLLLFVVHSKGWILGRLVMFTGEDVRLCANRERLCVFAFTEPQNLPVLVRHASHWTLPNQVQSRLGVVCCLCVSVCVMA